MRDVIAMLLAGGRVEELSVLTHQRAKAAVPFGGQYRIIDFALSSLIQADLEKVGVLSLYRPQSLIEHLGIGEPWDLVGRGRGVKLLPSYMSDASSQWYRGTADAIWQNLDYISNHEPRDVLVLAADHIHNVDFNPVLEQHRATDADLTMVVKQMDPALGGGRFGVAELDAEDRVIGYQDKASQPSSDLVSLTMYLFKSQVLLKRLNQVEREDRGHQLYSDVLPLMIERDRVFGYRHTGYWNYTRTVDAYHQAHMDLLGEHPLIDMDDWATRSRRELKGLGDLPPARIESSANCRNAMVSPGSIVAGEVVNSVISPGVLVEAGARVVDSVVMHGTVIQPGAVVERAILDKNVVVGPGAQVGQGPSTEPNHEVPEALKSGVSLVGKKAIVPSRVRIQRNCVVYPEVAENDWARPELLAGMCLHSGGGTK
jgi:glucose-1-phosphate adenylyltransferase